MSMQWLDDFMTRLQSDEFCQVKTADWDQVGEGMEEHLNGFQDIVKGILGSMTVLSIGPVIQDAFFQGYLAANPQASDPEILEAWAETDVCKKLMEINQYGEDSRAAERDDRSEESGGTGSSIPFSRT